MKFKETPRDFAETFKNQTCAHIFTLIFSLTDNFQNSRKKGKKEKKDLP